MNEFKLYDTAFKVGFGLTVLVFVILNLISYFTTEDEFVKRGFNPPIGAKWGFPLAVANHSGWEIEPLSFSINVFIIVGCGFIIGLIFKFVWSKFREKSLK